MSIPAVRRLLCFLIIAAWTAGTAHCALEAIHVTPDSDPTAAAETGCCAQTNDCLEDACDIVEDTGCSMPSSDLDAPPPQLFVERCLACLHAALLHQAQLEAPAPAFRARHHQPVWMPERHMLRREAAPARAPNPLV